MILRLQSILVAYLQGVAGNLENPRKSSKPTNSTADIFDEKHPIGDDGRSDDVKVRTPYIHVLGSTSTVFLLENFASLSSLAYCSNSRAWIIFKMDAPDRPRSTAISRCLLTLA
jgi:hypothetical protein